MKELEDQLFGRKNGDSNDEIEKKLKTEKHQGPGTRTAGKNRCPRLKPQARTAGSGPVRGHQPMPSPADRCERRDDINRWHRLKPMPSPLARGSIRGQGSGSIPSVRSNEISQIPSFISFSIYFNF